MTDNFAPLNLKIIINKVTILKKHTIKGLLSIVIIIIMASCNNDLGKKLEDKLNGFDSKAENLDLLLNKELDRVGNIDSLINFDNDKIKKLDSVITESSSRMDSIAGKKIELLKEILK